MARLSGAKRQRVRSLNLVVRRAERVEDNADYYRITDRGEIVYWSHNGSIDHRWPNLAVWRDQVCVRRK